MRHHQWDVTDEMEFGMVQRRLHPGAGCQGQGAKGHPDPSHNTPTPPDCGNKIEKAIVEILNESSKQSK